MSVQRKKTYDVFVSHRRVDAPTARKLSRALAAVNLVVYDEPTSTSASRFGEEVREALAESRVLVVILSEASWRSTTVAMEVGAARAWQKAVYVLLSGVAPNEVPPFLRELETFSEAQISSLVQDIQGSASPLTDSMQATLARVYQSSTVPSDQLARKPMALERLTRRFNRLAKTSFTPERLLQELIRMRKKGKLPPLSK